MGEFDVSTLEDGDHEDVGIARIQQHEKWDKKLLINDIAILHLERDVIFNGIPNHNVFQSILIHIDVNNFIVSCRSH